MTEPESSSQGSPKTQPAEETQDKGAVGGPDFLGEPGPPLDHKAPFYFGFVGATGALLAFWLAMNIAAIGSTLMLIVVAFFIAAGLNPSVEWIERRGVRRRYAVIYVIIAVLIALVLFLVAIVPVITDQVASITANAPGWLDQLQDNKQVQELDDEYQIIDKIRDYVTDGDFLSAIFGGALGFGLAVLGALFNGFIVLVLTLYFLSSLSTTKSALYRLAPASRRDRVTRLGDRIIRSVGGTSPAPSSWRRAPASHRWSSCSSSDWVSTPWRWRSSSRCWTSSR